MNYASEWMRASLGGLCAYLFLAMVVVMPSKAQEQRVAQTACVDNAKMSTYRALAQLSFRAFQLGDSAEVAELARALERTWDASRDDKTSVFKTNRALFDEIDNAMDGFIKPLTRSGSKAPDAATMTAVTTAYQEFLSKLKKGDT